jgi:uncharacterized phage protein (TIGR02220 family)
MNYFELCRAWWDFAFENPEKIKPNHSALYLFAVEHCNRLGWKSKFGLPTEMAKDAIGIRSYRTYINTLRDLVQWGLITMVEKSQNQYSANIIALAKFDKSIDRSLDKAMIKHAAHSEEMSHTEDRTVPVSGSGILLDDSAFAPNAEKVNLCRRVIKHLNDRTDSSFPEMAHPIHQQLVQLIKEGYTEQDITDVIDLKVMESQTTDAKNQPLYRPEWIKPKTIFETEKFMNYVQDARKWRDGRKTSLSSESTKSRNRREASRIEVKLYN